MCDIKGFSILNDMLFPSNYAMAKNWLYSSLLFISEQNCIVFVSHGGADGGDHYAN